MLRTKPTSRLNNRYFSSAGVSLQKLQSVIADATVAAMIPNTPVAVNAGTIGLTLPEEIPEENANKIITFLNY